eukprot:2793299-Pyramimonas_sp.AAC.1
MAHLQNALSFSGRLAGMHQGPEAGVVLVVDMACPTTSPIIISDLCSFQYNSISLGSSKSRGSNGDLVKATMPSGWQVTYSLLGAMQSSREESGLWGTPLPVRRMRVGIVATSLGNVLTTENHRRIQPVSGCTMQFGSRAMF